MEYKIEKQNPTRHRETTFSEFVETKFKSLKFGDIYVFVVKLDNDQKWWIIPSCYDDDEKMDDTGPYDEVEDAMLMLRLMGDD